MLFEIGDEGGAPPSFKLVGWGDRRLLLYAKPAGFLSFSLGCLLFGAVPDTGAVGSDLVIGLVDRPGSGRPQDLDVASASRLRSRVRSCRVCDQGRLPGRPCLSRRL